MTPLLLLLAAWSACSIGLAFALGAAIAHNEARTRAALAVSPPVRGDQGPRRRRALLA